MLENPVQPPEPDRKDVSTIYFSLFNKLNASHAFCV